MKKIIVALSLTALLAACSSEKVATVDDKTVEVSETGDFFITGQVSEDFPSFYLNDQLFFPNYHDEEGNYEIGANVAPDAPEKAEFRITAGGDELLKETIEIDASAYEDAVARQEQENLQKEEEAKESAIKEEAETEMELNEINNMISSHLEDNKGWALGTIDENGNETNDGEANPDYQKWLFVNAVEYTGNDIEVQVTEDFKTLSETEKNELASSAQGMVMSYADENRLSVYFFNGEESLGGSKMLDKNDYSWN